MTSAWEAIRGDRRDSPRYRLSLSASVLIYEGIEEGRWPAVLATTSDISREGLRLIMPTFGVWYHALQDGTTTLRIMLALPEGHSVDLIGASSYCHPRRGDAKRTGYLIGVSLKESEGLAIYRDFIDSLHHS